MLIIKNMHLFKTLLEELENISNNIWYHATDRSVINVIESEGFKELSEFDNTYQYNAGIWFTTIPWTRYGNNFLAVDLGSLNLKKFKNVDKELFRKRRKAYINQGIDGAIINIFDANRKGPEPCAIVWNFEKLNICPRKKVTKEEYRKLAMNDKNNLWYEETINDPEHYLIPDVDRIIE